MASSYTKVYERMADHKVVRKFLEQIPEMFNQVHVFDVEFVLVRPDVVGDPAHAEPRFKVLGPSGETMTTQSGELWLTLGTVVCTKKIDPFIDQLFGTPGGVPTYFCNKDTVKSGNGQRDSFTYWLQRRESLQNKYDVVVQAARARVQAEVNDWKASEMFVRKEREYLVGCATRDIKQALAAYNHLGQDVLKLAVDEYLVHSIFEFESS